MITSKVKLPRVIEVENCYIIKRLITMYIIDSEEVSFLCGQKMFTDWKTFFSQK